MQGGVESDSVLSEQQPTRQCRSPCEQACLLSPLGLPGVRTHQVRAPGSASLEPRQEEGPLALCAPARTGRTHSRTRLRGPRPRHRPRWVRCPSRQVTCSTKVPCLRRVLASLIQEGKERLLTDYISLAHTSLMS